MARIPRRRPYQQIPKGRLRIGAFFWTVAMTLGLVAIGVMAATAVTQSDMTYSRLFSGTLQSKTQPVVIEVPQGAVIQDVLATTGDKVRRGQTLVTFDEVEIGHAIEDLENLNRRDRASLHCLVSPGADNAPQTKSEPLPDDSCQRLEIERKNLTHAFEAQRSKTEREISFIETYIANASVLHRRNPKTPETKASLDRILALSLTRSSLEDALAQAQISHDEAIGTLSLQKTELLARTKEALRKRQMQISKLNDLLDAPRLHAPFSGKIVRHRRVPKGHAATSRVEIFSLIPQREVAYTVRFQVPDQDRHLVKIGESIKLETIGLPELIDHLTAVIKTISRDGPSRLSVVADLTVDATQALVASPYSRQILDNSSAVSVRIHKLPVPAAELVKSTFSEVIVLKNATLFSALLDGFDALSAWLPAALDRLG